MDVDQARAFLQENHRAVLATQRSDGRPQLSPVAAVVADDGRVLISSRETAIKVKNLRKNALATLCVLNDGFFGDWCYVEGPAEIVSLPDAMDLLVDYYRRAAGEHPDWDDYRAAMERERRVTIRITIERAGPTQSG